LDFTAGPVSGTGLVACLGLAGGGFNRTGLETFCFFGWGGTGGF